jgi:hypothetical protein
VPLVERAAAPRGPDRGNRGDVHDPLDALGQARLQRVPRALGVGAQELLGREPQVDRAGEIHP